MDEATARNIAAGELAAMQAEVDAVDEDKRRHQLPALGVEYVITAAERISDTWCVFYNNRRFVETGGIAHALAGNGAILIGPDGQMGRAGSGLPTEHYVAEFEHSPSARDAHGGTQHAR